MTFKGFDFLSPIHFIKDIIAQCAKSRYVRIDDNSKVVNFDKLIDIYIPQCHSVAHAFILNFFTLKIYVFLVYVLVLYMNTLATKVWTRNGWRDVLTIE